MRPRQAANVSCLENNCSLGSQNPEYTEGSVPIVYYLVSITDESGKVVYKKAVNAGNIVGLNIDISAYSKGRYTVTVENNDEVFTGQFEAQTTGIETIIKNKVETRPSIYNLQGQRLSSMQKGLNIFNGQKIFVK